MLKSEIKKLVLGHIDPILKPARYKVRHADGTRYYLDKDGLTISWILLFYRIGAIQVRGVLVTHQEVEKILECIPDEDHLFGRDIYRRTLLTPTIIDSSFEEMHSKMIFIETEDEAKPISRSYLDYILGAGKEFVEHYSYLPNVLKRMHELEAEGLSWQNPNKGILEGSIDAFFRGLIISKLCNDSQFDSKVEFCDRYLYDGTNDEWVPYYEKLKAEVLPTIEPKYNI